MTDNDSDDFILIDDTDVTEADAERRAAEEMAPWIRPDHPLYFCDTQTSLTERSAALNAYSLENWYEALKDYTFRTAWLPVTAAEARALFHVGAERGGVNTQAQFKKNLADKIDAALLAFVQSHTRNKDAPPPSAFLRLSTRSPKDSTALDDSAVHFMLNEDDLYWPREAKMEKDNQHHRAAVSQQPVPSPLAAVSPLANRQMASYTAGMLRGLRVDSGQKAVDIVAKSHKVACDMAALLSAAHAANAANGVSEKGNEEGDVIKTTQEGKDTDDATIVTSVILREWVDARLDHEFRIFVTSRCRRNDKEEKKTFVVTGITQYFHYIHFNFMPDGIANLDNEERNALKTFLTEFVEEKIVPLLRTLASPTGSSAAKTYNADTIDGKLLSAEEGTGSSSPCEFIVDVGLVRAAATEPTLNPTTITIRGVEYAPMVIELNPFAPAATGGMLFDWKKDLGLLWRGEEPISDGAEGPTVTTFASSAHLPCLRIRDAPREDFENISLLPVGCADAIRRAAEARRHE